MTANILLLQVPYLLLALFTFWWISSWGLSDPKWLFMCSRIKYKNWIAI